MSRQKLSSGSRYEEFGAYSRAVVDGDWIFVSGTAATDPVTGEIPEGAEAQTRAIFDIIEGVLARADAGLEDVVRCRVYLTDAADLEGVFRIIGVKFRDVRPANTTIICKLPVPKARVEIEVTARRRGD
jgi:enamine deaminase RidA (YjgF/YER057c/UK114 family)